MHGRTVHWLACTLAAAVVFGACGLASAQDTILMDPGYAMATSEIRAPAANKLMSTSGYMGALEARVAALETALQDEAEAVRSALPPGFADARARHVVVAAVDLHRVEMTAVVFEPLALLHVGRVEHVAPVLVAEPRRADMQAAGHCRIALSCSASGRNALASLTAARL